MANEKWGEPESGTASKKILIIVQDVWIRNSLLHYAKSLGFSALATETAKEGKAALTKEYFEYIIVDSSLPDSTGIGLYRQIQHQTRRATKILISVEGEDGVVNTAKEMGIQLVTKSSLNNILDQLSSSFFDNTEPLLWDR